MQVTLASELTEWDDFVARSQDSTFAHLAGWRNIMRDVLRHRCLYLIARDDHQRIAGVLPLVQVKGLAGHFLVSVPFVNDGGPIGTAGARTALTEFAVAEAQRIGAGLLELRNRTEVVGPVQHSFRKVAVHLPLPPSLEELWSTTFKAKLRSQIRRPAKEGMTATVGSDQLDAFYRVFSRNMRDLGTPVLPRAFFSGLLSAFGDRVMFVTVYTADGRPAAASCSLQWREELEVTWASSLREYNKLSPNMLLYGTMMEQAISRGARVFNFGRSSPGSATHKFKQQWGGHDVQLPWAFWSRSAEVGTPSADSRAFQLAQAAWKRMPLAVANLLGPFLSRQLP
ncbi:MAG: FemAB family XrtA/PEP-CTERM system-associated protein [Gemmatimonadota bacterium]